MPIEIRAPNGGGAPVITHKAFRFSGGETQVRIDLPAPDAPKPTRLLLCAKLFSADDIMELMLVTDALRRQFGQVPIRLQMPYFPYGRQDRVCYPGEALAARVMADTINALRYEAVEVWDAHSSVTEALLERCHNVPAAAWAGVVGPAIGQHYVVAPDAGAGKRALLWAQQFEPALRVLEARKIRHPKDGSISGAAWECPSNSMADSTYLMVDDICDGGRTFCELAKVMRQTELKAKIMLFVSHGIFSKGFEPFRGLIDRIYCPNVWPSVPEDELLVRL